MYVINKISSYSAVDYAAEELRKYLRMMMPECGNIEVKYDPEAKDGFRLGLMQDFGLDVSDAEEPELDDILYIDTDLEGGIIAGDNPRSVLLSVYEYLRQNGCRWLMPGVDGEFIPMQDIKAVKYRHKPSCRYRGQCNEGQEFQTDMLEVIEFTPKIGMNVFMMEWFVPPYYRSYYNHKRNSENRIPEPVSDMQIVQWKRQCESEIAKRGLQFHDIGHGFTINPFGIPATLDKNGEDLDKYIPENSRKYLAMINGERKLYQNIPSFTNFCMSNTEARKLVVNYVADYAKNHGNSDYIHVWLADGTNNHCECEECVKKTPSDWYIVLLNEIDEKLAEEKLDTRIVFISYVDTTWAPLVEKIKNPKRFTCLFAPICRSYAYSIPEEKEIKLEPYKRNNNIFPPDLASSFAYFEEWKKVWKGANVAYEYHFWRHQSYDVSGFETAKRVNDDVKLYKLHGVNGVIEDGSQRSYFPNGFAFYSYARTLFDTSLSFEEIQEEYFSCAYGEDWKEFRDYLGKLQEAIPFDFFSRDEARNRKNVHYDPKMAKQIASVREITKDGRKLIAEHYNSDYRIRTVSVRLLEYHAEFCELLSDWLSAKADGELEKAAKLYEKARIQCGKREIEFEKYFDHGMFFAEHSWALNQKSPAKDAILTI